MSSKTLHFAEVTRNFDENEKLRGAIFFKSDTLTGDKEFPIAAEPCFPIAGQNGFGFFAVPEPGDIVEIEIDDAVEHPQPRWRCSIYSSVDEIAREFRKNYPKRMGFRTKTGHVLIWDDTEGAEEVFFEHTFGSRIKFSTNGNISFKARQITNRDEDDEINDIEATEFAELLFDFNQKVIHLHDHHPNSIKMNSSGVVALDKNNNKITMDSSGVIILDKNSNKTTKDNDGIIFQDLNGNKITMNSFGIEIIDLNGNKITLDSTGININSITQFIKIDGSIYGSHQHVGNLGIPTLAPIDANTE